MAKVTYEIVVKKKDSVPSVWYDFVRIWKYTEDRYLIEDEAYYGIEYVNAIEKWMKANDQYFIDCKLLPDCINFVRWYELPA